MNSVKALLRTLFVVSLVLVAAGVGAQQSDVYEFEELNASIMRPSISEIMEWDDQVKKARKAYISDDINKQLLRRAYEGQGSSVNLLGYVSYVPEERQQGSCGNCWNWACTGVVEVALNVQEGISDRLSTQYLNSCKTDNFACCGGTLVKFVNWYEQVGMFFPWSNNSAHFADGDTTCDYGSSVTYCGSVSTSPNYPITSISYATIPTADVGKATAIANLKNVLNQNKAAYFAFYLPTQAAWDRFFSFWNGPENTIWDHDLECGQAYGNDGGGHAVLLVGYNDQDPNPENHYWVLLNSWGTSSGNRPNGLYRMKMNMDYDCLYSYENQNFNAVFWQTIDVQFSQNSPQCTYSVYPATVDFNSSGGGGAIEVTSSSPGCAWTAASNASWIVLESANSGTGNGSVQYRIPANSGNERTGTLTVAGKTVTITQAGSQLSTNILNNPGFENGEDGSWVSSGWILWKIPCFTQAGYDCAYQGDWAAWFGGYDYEEYDFMYQDFTIPSFAKNATLRFRYAIGTNEEDNEPYDIFEVGIGRNDNDFYKNILSLSNVDATSDWVQSQSFDVSEFIGKDIYLYFDAQTDENVVTNFFIDEVELLIGTDTSFADNGIWKNSNEGISFYLQKYQTGSAVIAIMANNTLTAFLDPAYRDGIDCKDDVMAQGGQLSLSLNNSTSGTLTLKLPGKTGTYPVSLAFPDDGSTSPFIPTNAIWHSSDGKLKFYLQKYEAGSCVIVMLAEGKFTVFLDEDYEDGIDCSHDVLGRAYSLSLMLTGSTSGMMTVNLPGISGVYWVSFKYPENS
ncbi:MAG: hypothetical protein HY788_16355 [Deltaproteobacteria bacterium]|nr:hypothetical protein [Deltaproteobacteria bacterium]